MVHLLLNNIVFAVDRVSNINEAVHAGLRIEGGCRADVDTFYPRRLETSTRLGLQLACERVVTLLVDDLPRNACDEAKLCCQVAIGHPIPKISIDVRRHEVQRTFDGRR